MKNLIHFTLCLILQIEYRSEEHIGRNPAWLETISSQN